MARKTTAAPDIHALIAKHGAALAAIGAQLAVNFDTPAQRTINAGFERLGIPRFTRAGDDLWEMYTAHSNGWAYTKPPRRLIDRWSMA